VQEHVLFKYDPSWVTEWNRGSVLVTDQRVVLSGRIWNLDEIVGAQLVTDRIRSRYMSVMQPPSNVIVLGWGLALVAGLLFGFLSLSGTHSDLLNCIGILLFLSGLGCIVFNNYQDVYRLQLTLKDGRQQIADNWWYVDHARPARRTVEAIAQVLAAYHDAGKP
jgi:hypothetical protein